MVDGTGGGGQAQGECTLLVPVVGGKGADANRRLDSSTHAGSDEDTPTSTALHLDTWNWVCRLREEGSLTTAQGEALLQVVQRIAKYRLEGWQSLLIPRNRLHQDLNLLHTAASELDRQQNAAGGRLDAEQRARYERVASELHAAADQLRDLTTSTRTDLALLVTAFKAQSREDGQRLEIDLHRLEGRLTTALGTFKSESEHVKARSVYAFSRKKDPLPIHLTLGTLFSLVVICAIFLAVIADRSMSNSQNGKREHRTTMGHGRVSSDDID